MNGEGEQEGCERVALFYAFTLGDAVVDAGVVAPRVVALASLPQAQEREHSAKLRVRAEFGEQVMIMTAKADHRNPAGYILDGPEFLTVFDGRTGAALATTDYVPPRGDVAAWGDDYGNRVDRFLACVAYLDGGRPSLVMCRGYYTRAVLAAWNWRDGKLTPVWTFDSDDGTEGNRDYRGQGNHGVAVGEGRKADAYRRVGIWGQSERQGRMLDNGPSTAHSRKLRDDQLVDERPLLIC